MSCGPRLKPFVTRNVKSVAWHCDRNWMLRYRVGTAYKDFNHSCIFFLQAKCSSQYFRLTRLLLLTVDGRVGFFSRRVIWTISEIYFKHGRVKYTKFSQSFFCTFFKVRNDEMQKCGISMYDWRLVKTKVDTVRFFTSTNYFIIRAICGCGIASKLVINLICY